jgi:UDP-N-acetylmuramate--alanine ligase
VVRCADDDGAMAVPLPAGVAVLSYSATAPGDAPARHAATAQLVACDLRWTSTGSVFRVERAGADLGTVTLAVPGVHNVRNALAALASGLALGATVDAMAPGLAGFRGVERRFQRLGVVAGVEVIDDYAHHPTEVAATLAAARLAFPGQRILVAFQPHLYSRTRDLQAEFAAALAAADGVFLCDIYGARETPMPGVTSALIGDRLPTGRLAWSGPRTAVAQALRTAVTAGDVVVTMGAGDITRTGPELLAVLSA